MAGKRLLTTLALALLSVLVLFATDLASESRFHIKWYVVDSSVVHTSWVQVLDYTATTELGKAQDVPDIDLTFSYGEQGACTLAYITNFGGDNHIHQLTVSRSKGFVPSNDLEAEGIDFDLIIDCSPSDFIINDANPSVDIYFRVPASDSFTVYYFPVKVDLTNECFGSMVDSVKYVSTITLEVVAE